MKHFDFKSFVRGRQRLPARLLHAPGRHQRGAAVLLTVVLLLMIAAVGITRYATSGASLTIQHVTDNSAQIAAVKAALIAYAMNGRNPAPAACPSTTNARPGELPCPDTNNDGVEECTCSGNSLIGRVPWKTLGIPDPKDASGETLWYAVSASYQPYDSTGAPVKINSDTKGTLPVYKDDQANLLTNEAIAVIIAPGTAIGSQTRSTTLTVDCTSTGTTVVQNLCANNYLESTNWRNSGPFLMALNTPNPGTFNDQVQSLTTADIMPLVEQRVGKDVIALLKQYKTTSTCNCFPWADSDAARDGSSNSSNRYGALPLVTALPENWGSGAIPAVPVYLTQNDWWSVLYYAVGDRITQTPSTFNVFNYGGGGNTSVVVITPGPAGATRPSSNWSDYVDDATNVDGDDTFATPASSAYTKDHLFSIPYPYP